MYVRFRWMLNSKEDYDNYFLTTKSRLLEAVSSLADVIRDTADRSSDYHRQYYYTLADQLDCFYGRVDQAYLPEELDDWWSYVVRIGCTGISLYVRHCEYAQFQYEDDLSTVFLPTGEGDATYKLLEQQCGWLTTADFAEANGCERSTVYAWIKMGILRSARKCGNRWLIPELTQPIKYDYPDPVSYTWDTPLFDLPSGFSKILVKPGTIDIRRAEDDGYIVSLLGTDMDTDTEIYLAKDDAERLERYLIASPQVVYTGDDIIVDF